MKINGRYGPFSPKPNESSFYSKRAASEAAQRKEKARTLCAWLEAHKTCLNGCGEPVAFWDAINYSLKYSGCCSNACAEAYSIAGNISAPNYLHTSMTSYKELLAQREELEKKITTQRAIELADAIQQVRGLIAQYDLSHSDLFPGSSKRAPKTTGSKVAPKYRNAETGATWTGRGKPPAWIANKNRDEFLI